MRVAIADIGTNSTRLLVADVDAGALREVERLLEITRLGQGVDASGTLAGDAIERVLACLDHYAERARALGAERRIAVATSAVRDASNRDELLREIAGRGFEPRVLSGSEEAAATFAGVASDMSSGGEIAVVDVGGGSSEVVLARDGAIGWSESYAAGCVRMAERHLGPDVVLPGPLARCREDLAEILAGLADAAATGDWKGIAVAGTATTVAAVDLGVDGDDAAQIHGHRISRDVLLAELARLGAMSLRERRGVTGVSPDRAPVICAGIVVLDSVLERLGLDEVVVSERDVLHGAALQAAA
jgi:exopolyphosphatase/guanosine-5'-triphosphate,3'-diphosphate pyrophosphatase